LTEGTQHKQTHILILFYHHPPLNSFGKVPLLLEIQVLLSLCNISIPYTGKVTSHTGMYMKHKCIGWQEMLFSCRKWIKKTDLFPRLSLVVESDV